MREVFRPVTEAEAKFIIIRAGMDALTTGQADPAGIPDLDRALWDMLRTEAQELDRI